MATRNQKISPVAQEAVKRMQEAEDDQSENRQEAMDDLEFSHGDGAQWPASIRQERQLDRRPCLEINKTDTFVRSVVNNIRQQRPRIKVHPVSDGADQQTADVIEGLIRHIETQSCADVAYDTAAEYQIRMGWGYWRITTDYCDDESFDQEIFIKRIHNPFSVYLDPSSTDPAGLDAKWCVITDRIRREDFVAQYPHASEQDFVPSSSDGSRSAWSSRHEIMIAEYWRVENKSEELLRLSDGSNVLKSKLAADAHDGEKVPSKIGDMWRGLMVIDSRPTVVKTVKWSKVTKTQELESREWAGKYIPVVPVYGAEILQGGRIKRFGMVRNLKDPQRMYNFWRTSQTERVALAPKAPWLIAEGQIDDHEDEWATANTKNHSTLTWRAVVEPETSSVMPPPTRIEPPSIPAADMQAAMAASDDLKAVAGMFDPSLGADGGETSGTMVAQRQQQSDKSNYHFYDNITRSIRATGIIILDLIPHIYNAKRVIRIIKPDGNPDIASINEPDIDKIINDVTVGRYDVIMETGPGYDTKRLEASESLLKLAQIMPDVMQHAADLIVSQLDIPMAETLTERLKMANPLAQTQDDIPKTLDPKARQIIAQMQGQLQQAQQQLQQLQQEKAARVFGIQEKAQADMQLQHFRQQSETHRQIEREVAETHRTEMREHGDTYRAHLAADAKIHANREDNSTSLEETLIDAQTNLEIAHRQAMRHGVPVHGRNVTP